MKVTLKMAGVFSITLGFLSSCTNEPIPEPPIYPGFTSEIKYVRLALAVNTNSATMVADGKRTIQLTLEQFGEDKKLIASVLPPGAKVRINGNDLLPHPFAYSTNVPGMVEFTLEGFPETAVLGRSVKIQAVANKEYEEITLPVVFHFIVEPGSIPDLTSLQTLMIQNLTMANIAFHDQRASKDPNAVDSKLTFVPSTHDPHGEPLALPGIHIVESADFKFSQNQDYKLQLIIWNGNFWSPQNYVNIWVADFDSYYSWAYFPSFDEPESTFPESAYGVMLNLKHFKMPGLVLAHEFGHILNLRHNFDPACTLNTDGCSDTEDYKREYDEVYSGGLMRNSCAGNEFKGVNYMDYAPGEFNTFTFQQRERMRFTLTNCPYLPTPANGSRVGDRQPVVSSKDMLWVMNGENSDW